MTENTLQSEIFTILYIVFGILGGIGGIEAGHRLYSKFRKKEGKFDWKHVENGTKELIGKIKEDGFIPDVIVSLGRGGAVLGAMLSGNMGLIPLLSLDRKYEWNEGKHRRVIIFGSLDKDYIKNKNVLLAQAFPYTGNTVLEAKKFIAKLYPKKIMTASLVKSELSTFIPDFYVYKIKEVKTEPWRIFPEYRRDSKSPN